MNPTSLTVFAQQAITSPLPQVKVVFIVLALFEIFALGKQISQVAKGVRI